MEQTVRKIAWYSLLTLIMVVIIGVVIYAKSDVQQTLGGEAAPLVVDIIGTKTGTSTTAVDFGVAGAGGQSATTTYPYMIGNETDSAIYTLQVKNASSTSNLIFSVLGSNDIECDTASTTSSLNAITTGEINWFDISDHLNNKVHSTSFSAATSTLAWVNPTAFSGKELILTNLNFNCIALQVSGSSSTLWAQLETKKFR